MIIISVIYGNPIPVVRCRTDIFAHLLRLLKIISLYASISEYDEYKGRTMLNMSMMHRYVNPIGGPRVESISLINRDSFLYSFSCAKIVAHRGWTGIEGAIQKGVNPIEGIDVDFEYIRGERS